MGGKRQKRKTAQKKKGVVKSAKRAGGTKGREEEEEEERELSALLDDIIKKNEAEVALVVTEIERPTVRTGESMCANPLTDELIIFGGELDLVKGKKSNTEEEEGDKKGKKKGKEHDDAHTTFLRDVLRYQAKKNKWLQYKTGLAPPPRSSHHAVVLRIGSVDFMYIFGGEFADPGGDKFMHFSDLWRLNLQSFEWEQVKWKGSSPSARSGSRMAVWKKKICLFGGFFEPNYKQTRFMNDFWTFDTEEEKWEQVEYPWGSQQPPARSGSQVAVYSDYFYLFGGYAKVKEERKKGMGNRKDDTEDEYVGISYNDVWRISLNPKESALGSSFYMWEQVSPPNWKNSGLPREIGAGAAMATYKNQAVLFGGCVESRIWGVPDTLHNDIMVFSFDNHKWYPVQLAGDSTEPHVQEGDSEETSSTASAAATDGSLERPCARYGTRMAVLGTTLYLFGGVLDTRSGCGITALDDMWTMDLKKKDKFRLLFQNTEAIVPQTIFTGKDDEESDEEEDGDESDGSGNESDQHEVAGDDFTNVEI